MWHIMNYFDFEPPGHEKHVAPFSLCEEGLGMRLDSMYGLETQAKSTDLENDSLKDFLGGESVEILAVEGFGQQNK